MDKAFEILSSRGSLHSNIFRRALSEEDKAESFAFIYEFIPYSKGLQLMLNHEKKRVFDSINFTPVLGFVPDFTNLRLMYQEYVENGTMKEICTYA